MPGTYNAADRYRAEGINTGLIRTPTEYNHFCPEMGNDYGKPNCYLASCRVKQKMRACEKSCQRHVKPVAVEKPQPKVTLCACGKPALSRPKLDQRNISDDLCPACALVISQERRRLDKKRWYREKRDGKR